MIKKQLALGSLVLLGGTLLAGCGAPRHLAATPTGNGHHKVSDTAHSGDVYTSSGPSTPIPSSNFSGSSSPSTVQTGFKTYRNIPYHFSLQYPTTWTPMGSSVDGGGQSFIFDTHLPAFSNHGFGLDVPHHLAVINAVAVYNAAHMTYAKARRPNNPFITSYHVEKYETGYEIQEQQKRGMELSYSIMFFNQTYVKTLMVVVPNQLPYKQIALAVVKSYNPLS